MRILGSVTVERLVQGTQKTGTRGHIFGAICPPQWETSPRCVWSIGHSDVLWLTGSGFLPTGQSCGSRPASRELGKVTRLPAVGICSPGLNAVSFNYTWTQEPSLRHNWSPQWTVVAAVKICLRRWLSQEPDITLIIKQGAEEQLDVTMATCSGYCWSLVTRAFYYGSLRAKGFIYIISCKNPIISGYFRCYTPSLPTWLY